VINLWRPDFRRTLGYGFVALAALVTGSQFGAATVKDRLITYGCALLVAVFGVTATRTAAREVHRFAAARAGEAAATPLRVMVELIGYLIAVVSVCDLLDVGLQRLLVAGSVTGIVLGLAAQPVLGNLFAGLVILFARPYVPGTRVRVVSGALNGPHVGTIVSAGLLYTVLQTDEGPLNIPNSALMAAAVGPTTADAADVPSAQR
jgi:small-conductance mechanosensitive channel